MSKTVFLPVILARKIDLVAKSKNLTFNEAVSFLLQKVEAPYLNSPTVPKKAE